jgi:hypothetical protein
MVTHSLTHTKFIQRKKYIYTATHNIHTLPLTHTVFVSSSHTETLFLSLSHTQAHTLSHTHIHKNFLSIPLSLILTHTLSILLSVSLTLSVSVSVCRFLSFTDTHTHTHTHTHTDTHTIASDQIVSLLTISHFPFYTIISPYWAEPYRSLPAVSSGYQGEWPNNTR